MLAALNENGIPAEALAALPPEAKTFLEEMNYLAEDRLKVGDTVPSFELQTLDRSEWIQIGGTGASQPVALIFGSYT